MILFAGSQERGFFAQETAAIKEMELEYLQGSLTIKNHLNDILSRQCEYLIFDIEQYVDSAREVAEEIKRIEVAKNCQVIIYAPGYDRQSKIIRELQNQGILYYIFAVSQTEAREELERCLYGYYKEPETNPYQEEAEAQEELKPGIKIGIAGVCRNMKHVSMRKNMMQILERLDLKMWTCFISRRIFRKC